MFSQMSISLIFNAVTKNKITLVKVSYKLLKYGKGNQFDLHFLYAGKFCYKYFFFAKVEIINLTYIKYACK